jgi:hypothetical protein
MAYVKVHEEILDSSIWSECHATRIVWITMLAMADQDGVVQASIGGLAHRAHVTREECETALRCFLSPDPDSRDGTTGERIETVPGGWLLLNHANYREKQTREQVAVAERVARHRERQKLPKQAETLPTVTGVDVTPSNARKRLSASASASASESASVPDGFSEFWEAFQHKVARPNAERAWKRISIPPGSELAATIIDRAKAYAAATPDKAFRAHPATWLNRRGWEDELPAAPQPTRRVQPSEPPRNAMVPAARIEAVLHKPGDPDCQCENCCRERVHAIRGITSVNARVEKRTAQ